MQHFSSTFFINEKSPANPMFHSMTTPTLTLGSHPSFITLHFNTFKQIRELVKEINTLLDIQEEKYSEVKNA